MNIPWYVMFAVGLIPLACCYIVFPWFRAAVKRRVTFKPLNYDSLNQILADGMPERLSIECLQAGYHGTFLPHTHIDIYAHKNNTAVIRMRVDEKMPIARMFHSVLVDNINAFALPSSKPPLIVINQCAYTVLEYEYDDEYLLIYVPRP